MTVSRSQPEPATHAPASTVAIAWVVALLVSSLGDILWYELTGAAPGWLLAAKVGLLAVLIVLSWLWQPIRALRPFFVMLLAIATLTRAHTWLLALPAWRAWQDQQSFTVAALTLQLVEMGVALLLIGLLFLLRKHRQRFFLVRGDLAAVVEPVKWLGQKSPDPLWRFGLVFTLVVIVAQFFMFILPLSPAANTLWLLTPLIPVLLLLAASNGFNEEIILRAEPIATAYEVVGKSHAIWMAAVLLGNAWWTRAGSSGRGSFTPYKISCRLR